MIRIDRFEMQRLVVSAIGAIVVSATCIGAAIAPAKAADRTAPLTVSEWQSRVESRVDRIPAQVWAEPDHLTVSTVGVRFTADGDYAGVVMLQPSGTRLVDQRALTIARTVRYPALPEGFRGMPTQVRMTLYFGPDAEEAAAHRRKQAKQDIQFAAL